jgi:stress response protein YsnF
MENGGPMELKISNCYNPCRATVYAMSKRGKSDSSVHTMPLIAENYSVSKKNVQSDVVVEKRWVTKVETIRVPVRYEEIYVNGKALKPSKADTLVSAIKQSVGSKSTNAKKKAEAVPLFDDGATEKVIPLFGEQLNVTKTMSHQGDIAVRKQRVTEVKHVRVSTVSEKVKAKYASGRVEKIA